MSSSIYRSFNGCFIGKDQSVMDRWKSDNLIIIVTIARLNHNLDHHFYSRVTSAQPRGKLYLFRHSLGRSPGSLLVSFPLPPSGNTCHVSHSGSLEPENHFRWALGITSSLKSFTVWLRASERSQ